MLKLAGEATFTHEIVAHAPVDGGIEEQRFKATFRVIPVDDLSKFKLGTAEGTASFLRRAIVKLDELADERGNPVPYSDRVRDQVLNLPHARAALAKAYFDAFAGAREKN